MFNFIEKKVEFGNDGNDEFEIGRNRSVKIYSVTGSRTPASSALPIESEVC